jgi:uncharacterized protein (DUF1697 family)
MATHVALLRGVNVGGVKVPMAELRETATQLGWSDVATHLNSGNVLLTTDEDAATVESRLAAALEERYGRPLPVMARTPEELAGALERHPFADEDDKHRHIGFLAAAAAADWRERLGDVSPEAVEVDGREAFLHYPDGLGRSKLTPAVLERGLGVPMTVRGVRTVAGLIERC